jgi:hypothetical protein
MSVFRNQPESNLVGHVVRQGSMADDILPLAAVSTLLTLSIEAPTVRILNEHHLLDNGTAKTITSTPSSS